MQNGPVTASSSREKKTYFPGISIKIYAYSGRCCAYAKYGASGLHNSQKFRVRV